VIDFDPPRYVPPQLPVLAREVGGAVPGPGFGAYEVPAAAPVRPRSIWAVWRLPLLVAALGALISSGLFVLILHQQGYHWKAESRLMLEQVQQQMEDGFAIRLRALQRVGAQRQQARSPSEEDRFFDFDAQQLLADFPSFSAVYATDPGSRIRQSYGRYGEAHPIAEGRRLDGEAEFKDAFIAAAASRAPALSLPRTRIGATPTALLVVPVLDDTAVSGYVAATIDYEQLFPQLIHARSARALEFASGDVRLFRSGTPDGYADQRITVQAFGQPWTLSLWGSAEGPYDAFGPVVLAGGIVLSLLLSSALVLAGLARRRAEIAAAQAAELSQARGQNVEAMVALYDSQQQLQTLLDTMSDAFIALDPALRVVDANRQAQTLLGDGDGIAGRSISQLIPALAETPEGHDLVEALHQGRPAVRDVLLAAANLWLEVQVLPIGNSVALVLRDVSLRKRSELEFRRSSEAQQRAQQLARYGSWEFDLERMQPNWSPQMMAILGIGPDDVTGDPEQLFDFVYPADGDKLRAAIDALYAGATDLALEYRIVRTDGELREIEELSTSISNEAGQVVILTGVLRDVTDERRIRHIDEQQRAILQGVAQRQPLEDTLEPVARLLSQSFPGARCAILAVCEDGRRLQVRASAGVSPSFLTALDETTVALARDVGPRPFVRGEPVVVTDTRRDPRWSAWREMARRNAVGACWTLPLDAEDGATIGCACLFFEDNRQPRDQELAQARRLATLAEIAMTQHRAHEQLAFSEQRFRSLFDQFSDGVAVVDTRGVFQMANLMHDRITGIPQRLLLGRSIGDMPWPADRIGRLRTALAEALSGRTVRFEFHEAQGDEPAICIETTVTPILIDGDVLGAFTVVRDLSELRSVEARLLERDRFFELSSEAFCVLEGEALQLVQGNPAFERLLGYDFASLAGRSLLDLVCADERVKARQAWRRMLADGSDASAEMSLQTAVDGPVKLLWTAHLGADGCILATARDITARARAESALTASLAELRVRNDELTDFAFVASHDLQEPLRKIKTFSDRLLTRHDRQLDDQGQFYLSRIHASAGRMQELLDNLLAYARVSTEGRSFQSVDLNAIVANALLDLEGRIEATQARVNIGQLPRVSGDPVQLRQLFQNLLANALKFTVGGRRPIIGVLATREEWGGGAWVIEVTDNGIGFDPAMKDRLFGPFQRLHGRPEYEGTGMGLAIVKRIAERHGALVGAHASPGAGATFTVRFPDAQPLNVPLVAHG